MKYHEIPIAIQDRSFNDDGSLFYPDNRAFFEALGQPPNEPYLDIPFIPDRACRGRDSGREARSADASRTCEPEGLTARSGGRIETPHSASAVSCCWTALPRLGFDVVL
jgi:hypothetical protein